MQTLIKKKWNYLFFEDNGEYYITVLCGTVGLFDVVLKLNTNEMNSYDKDGEIFLDEFAQKVRNAPNNYENISIK